MREKSTALHSMLVLTCALLAALIHVLTIVCNVQSGSAEASRQKYGEFHTLRQTISAQSLVLVNPSHV